MPTKVVELNKLPKDKEFEEYIAAFFQAGGYYIERNLRKIGDTEVLELDIIITNYNYTKPIAKLCEIKSGGWGFPEIFKIIGWMQYIKFKKGLFIVEKTDKLYSEYYKQVSKELGISLIIIEDLSKTKKHLKPHLKSVEIEDYDIILWRYSYWLERNMLKILNSKKKSSTGRKCFKVMEDYYFNVNSGVFFERNLIERLISIYKDFKNNPRLSAKVGNEMNGEDFDEKHSSMPENVFKESFYECKFNDIQLSTFVEYTAKIAILKNLVDYILYKNAGDIEKTDHLVRFFGDMEYSKLNLLPENFAESLQNLSKHKFIARYAVFWQWFLWFFGGFILLDYKQQEYELLSKKTGIPIEEIDNAFNSFDILFPIDSGSWFFIINSNSNIKAMKMFPIPFRGIGANMRRMYYTKSGKFQDLELTGAFTRNDLITWNNLIIEILDKKFK